MKVESVLIEKNYEGSLVASAIVEGRRVHRVYIGYPKTFVMSDFKKYLSTLILKP